MARVKRGVTAHAKHKKVFKAAKGYYGRRKNTIRIAKQAVEKSLQYAYRVIRRHLVNSPRSAEGRAVNEVVVQVKALSKLRGISLELADEDQRANGAAGQLRVSLQARCLPGRLSGFGPDAFLLEAFSR